VNKLDDVEFIARLELTSSQRRAYLRFAAAVSFTATTTESGAPGDEIAHAEEDAWTALVDLLRALGADPTVDAEVLAAMIVRVFGSPS
jgi:hypothetical protein